MTLIDFPNAKPAVLVEKPKTLADWPWDSDLGKPYGDINGTNRFEDTPFYKEQMAKIANPPEEEVNDLARYKEPKDTINPTHYKAHPSGVECIQITEHMNFCLGNAVKYIWRADMKGGREDLEKAIWYLHRELRRR
jgi:hypothetical protein